MFANKAHISPVEQRLTLSSNCERIESNPEYHVQVDGKSIWDGHECMQRSYSKTEIKNAPLSGVGEQITEIDDLLSVMCEAHEACKDNAAQKTKLRDSIKIEGGTQA